MWDLIVSVPDHCLSFYFVLLDMMEHERSLPTGLRTAPFFLTNFGPIFHRLLVVSKTVITGR